MRQTQKIFTLLIIIMASWQLMGCAAASSKEMLAMLERQEAITIEVAEPVSQSQGEIKELDWKELASLDNYREFRDIFDDTLYITAHGESGKNGIVYVDLEGNHTNNSTLYYAFMNQKFRDNAWNNNDNMRILLDAAKSIYVDVESDAVAKVAVLNAYFNIFADAEPNYFNGNQTLTRGEYLAGVYRAGNPVSELEENKTFKDSVDGAGTDETTIFASQMLDYSYLSTDDESLNASTYNGKITRAEAIYTLVKMYYNDEYEALTGKENAGFSDAKNGGDIASKQKFITTDKETGVTNYNKYWKSYELSWSLQNPDKGMPDDLYKALVVAKNHGIITGSESRWDEAITKAEAVNFLAKLYMGMPSITNADHGTSVVVLDQVTQETLQAEDEANKLEEGLTESTGVEIVEVMDIRMYVVSAATIREGDGTNFKMINTLMKGGTAHVTGKTANGWYEVDCGTVKGYVPADALSTTNPNESTSTEQLTEEEQKRREENSALIEQFIEQTQKDMEEADTIEGSGQGNPKYDGHADAPSTHDWGN